MLSHCKPDSDSNSVGAIDGSLDTANVFTDSAAEYFPFNVTHGFTNDFQSDLGSDTQRAERCSDTFRTDGYANSIAHLFAFGSHL